MTKLSKKIAALGAALSLSLGLAAYPTLAVGQSSGTTPGSGVAFSFFNGVNHTVTDALLSLHLLRIQHGTTITVNGVTEQVNYDLFYNYTQTVDRQARATVQRNIVQALLGRDDRLSERYELFSDALNGVENRWLNAIMHASAVSDDTRNAVTSVITQHAQNTAQAVLTQAQETSTDLADYPQYRLRIESHLLYGRRLLFVGHSQGNLYVNSAYNYVEQRTPTGSPVPAQVVHIAPPSQQLAYSNAPYVLASSDIVIADTTLTRTPVPSDSTGNDRTGHRLLETYLSVHGSVAQAVHTAIATSLTTLRDISAPPRQVSDGFFTVTMTWDGRGDVDLHVKEPLAAGVTRRALVYYAAKQGVAGYLDYDNRVGFGPEHYYATDDNNRLLRGRYEIAVHNYFGAAGRTATLMVSDRNGNVVRTRSVLVPPNNQTVKPIFRVTIANTGNTYPDGTQQPGLQVDYWNDPDINHTQWHNDR